MPGSVMVWELTVGKRQILTFQARSPLVAADNTCAVAASGKEAEGCGPWRGRGGHVGLLLLNFRGEVS